MQHKACSKQAAAIGEYLFEWHECADRAIVLTIDVCFVCFVCNSTRLCELHGKHGKVDADAVINGRNIYSFKFGWLHTNSFQLMALYYLR